MINPISVAPLSSGRAMRIVASALFVLLIALVSAASANADLEFESTGFKLNEHPAPCPAEEIVLCKPSEQEPGAFTRQAGAHPDMTVSFSLVSDPDAEVDGLPTPGPTESVHDVVVDLPAGMVGDPTAIPTCTMTELSNVGQPGSRCPPTSQVGFLDGEIMILGGAGFGTFIAPVGLFNLAHGPDVPARLGFNYEGTVVTFDAQVRPGDYRISTLSLNTSQALGLKAIDVTIWGVPGDRSHDPLRQLPGDPGAKGWVNFLGWTLPPISSLIPTRPFLTTPTSCPAEPASFGIRADSWQNRGAFDSAEHSADPDGTPFVFEDCDKLAFDPSADVQALSHEADAPTGLNVDIDVPQSEDPDGTATAHVRRVVTTFPKGISISPSAATGLGACSPAQIGIGTNDAPTCPASSKLGTVKIDTPLLDEQLQGDVILAKQKENPFGSLLALYIAVKGPGFWLKLPGKVEADPQTGQLTTIFNDTPQQPFEHLKLELRGGAHASLQTPMSCGTYNARTEIFSWATDNPVVQEIPMVFDQGCNTGGFDPKLNAGTASGVAGDFSPFALQILREDGEQNLSRIEATLPEGLLAKLKGVALCSDAQAATGDCPAASQVGTTTIGAGPGSDPVYVPQAGKAPTAAYLAGPYKGAPYSLVVKVPAQAGPFDLGTVTVRNGLQIDPTTAQVTAKSDPLPQILEGIPVAYRDVRVEVNRPDFTVNPTNCDETKITSTLVAANGAVAHPSSLFQATGCGELGFKPKLKISLKGKMNRTGNPALTATLKAPKGEANIAKTTVILPQSQFIDQSHISNPCTRVQFDANDCPAGSILGKATAYSPLLDKALSGPVYFRSNGGARELPDLVADLNGQIHVTLVGFIDSVKTGPETSRVRTRFANVPDAPVSKFTIKLAGGKKGLIENSRDLCSFTPRAKVQMTGQNGKTANSNLKLGTSCGKGKPEK
jgi:hypothetical protein